MATHSVRTPSPPPPIFTAVKITAARTALPAFGESLNGAGGTSPPPVIAAVKPSVHIQPGRAGPQLLLVQPLALDDLVAREGLGQDLKEGKPEPPGVISILPQKV